MEPGEGIGALTATSIGEPLSQITLNSFHFSGSDNVAMVHGVPRIKELVGASRNLATPIVSLLLRPGLPNPRRAADTLVKNLPHTMLRSLLLDSRVIHEPDPLGSTSDGALCTRHRAFIMHAAPKMLPWVLRFQLCPERAGARALEPRMVADLVQERFGDTALVISSHVSDPEWVIRVYLLDADNVVATAMKRSLDTGTTRAAAKRASQRASLNSRRRRKHADLSAYVGGGRVPVPLELVGEGPTSPTARQVVEWMVSRNHLHELVSEMKVCGVDGIEAAAVRVAPRSVVDAATGAVTEVDEVWIDARGNNVVDCAQIEVFAGARTLTNDVMKVYEVAGITAAAHTLFHELCTCLGSAGSRVDERHVKLVCDAMCHDGFVMPFSRHGLNRMAKHGVLAKITFEEVLDQLVEAAVFGYFDPLHGVSENIMLGRPVTFGSNLSIVCTKAEDGGLVPCATSHAPPPETDTKVVRSVVVDADARSTLLEAQGSLEAEPQLPSSQPRQSQDNVRPARRGGPAVRMFSPDQVIEGDTRPASLQPFRPSSPQISQQHWSVRDAEPFRPSSPELL
jgi:DNA-directed RNA polymerase beta' subunit